MLTVANVLAIVALLLGSEGAASAQPEPRTEVDGVRPLLEKALREGSARGRLVGAIAEAMRKEFKTDAPLLVDVDAIAPLPDAGCKRLRIVTRQDGVVERMSRDGPLAAAQPMVLGYEINYCADGSRPSLKTPATPRRERP